MTENTDADIIKEMDGQMSLFTDAELKKMERGEYHGEQQCDSNHLC